MLKSLLYPDAQLPCLPAVPIPCELTGPSFAISPALGELLTRLCEDRHSVLEFGAGASSLVFANVLSPVRLTSLEQSPEWCADTWAKVEATGIDARLITVKPRLGWWPFPCHRYRVDISWRAPYDLVLIDAPQWYYGRDGALPLIAPYLSPGALIVVDDAGRHQEQWAIRRWLQTYPGLRLEVFDPTWGRNGVAVLRLEDSTVRPSLRAWLSGLLHVAVNGVVRTVRAA